MSFPAERRKHWMVVAALAAIAFWVLVIVSVSNCHGQEPQRPVVWRVERAYAGQSAFPVLDCLPRYPGQPIRNWWRVNIFGVPPLSPPAAQPMAPDPPYLEGQP